MTTNTHWRLSPVAWTAIAIAITAEAASNALKGYGLGSHLDAFTVSAWGHTASLSGAVLVLAAITVSIAQSRATWVALTPSRPAQQRIVAGLVAPLLLAMSITALASHVLEAQRAKGGDETGAALAYTRANDAYTAAKKELDALGSPRPVAVVQAEVQATKIDMPIWNRSKQCSDISKDDTREACRPILALYKERGQAARKAELEPEVSRLRDELAAKKPPSDRAPTALELMVADYWAWIMGLAVVFVATFGSVIFATAVPVAEPVPEVATAVPVAEPVPEVAAVTLPLAATPRPMIVEQTSRDEALADLRTLIKAGQHPESQDWLAERWNVSKSAVSKWLALWESDGSMPGNRLTDGRRKTIVS